MQPETLVAPAEELRVSQSSSATTGPEAKARLESALATVRDAFSTSTAGNNAIVQPEFRLLLRGLSRELMRQARPGRSDPWVSEVLGIIKAVTTAGGYDLPASGGDLLEASENIHRGWVGTVAAMLQAPSWELLTAPALDAVPSWLWSDYASWLYQVPPQQAHFEVSLLSLARVKRIQDLEHWVRRNPGAASVRAAVAAFLESDRVPFVTADKVSGRAAAEARGRMLAHFHLRNDLAEEPVPSARHGRRLRVAFIARDFGPGPEMFGALPGFEQLDPKQFEVFLFPFAASDSAEAAYCTRRTRGAQVLPTDSTERVEMLHKGGLDVVVFVGDLSRDFDAVAKLALHRIAPLQVVNSRSGFTTGLPEIDLYVSGTELPAAAFSERIGMLRGPAHSVAFARSGSATTSPSATREELGLPAAGAVVATVVDASGAASGTLETWAKILRESQSTNLAVAFVHDGDGSLVGRFCNAVQRVLAVHGLDCKRVTVFPTSAQRPDEMRTLFSVCDAYLDTPATGLAGWAAAEAFQAGLPVVTLREASSDVGTAMVKSLGLTDLVGVDASEFPRLIADLATDQDRRANVRARIAAALEATPEFLDSLAASDAFGALLEAAFDEMTSLGRTDFRRQTEPVRCFGVDQPTETIEAGLSAYAAGDLETAALEANLGLRSEPRNLRARFLVGQVLSAQGNHSRAVDYLLAVVQQPEATPAMWYALAMALRDNRQVAEAIQVLETCLRMDAGNVEVLLTLLELAERVGATEIARDVLQCLQQLAPHDPRVLAMS